MLKIDNYANAKLYIEDFTNAVKRGCWRENHGVISNSTINYIYEIFSWFSRETNLTNGFCEVLESNVTLCSNLSLEQAKCYLSALSRLENWASNVRSCSKNELVDLIHRHSYLTSREVAKEHGSLRIEITETQTIDEQLRSLECMERQQKAVVKIQAMFRRHLSTRFLLPATIRKKARKLIKSGQYSEAPKARGGITEVYLPTDCKEIVIKKLVKGNIGERIRGNLMIGDLLRRFDIQNIIIPSSWPINYFHIEKRLNINIKKEYNLGMYFNNLSAFDQVAREFVRLFSKIYIDDIVSKDRGVIYSNLPFLLEKNKDNNLEGKVGLIDAEYFRQARGLGDFKAVATIFPRHLDIIPDELANLYSKEKEEIIKKKHQMPVKDWEEELASINHKLERIFSSSYRSSLAEAAATTEKDFESSYLMHANYLNSNGITEIRPFEFFNSGVAEKEEILKFLSSELESSGINLRNQTSETWAKNFMLEFGKRFELSKEEAGLSEWEVVAGRTLYIEQWQRFSSFREYDFCIKVLMDYLQQKGYVFSFNKNFWYYIIKY